MAAAYVPGGTETQGDPCNAVRPEAGPVTAIPPVKDRGVILLSTATITEDNIYSNGLFQNVVVFYRMFEAMGYAPILIVNDKPKTLENIPVPLRKCRTIVTEDILRRPMTNLVALLEIGMSLEPSVRQFVKMLGGRLIKVYLGNILNIDIETPIFIPHHYFAHHVVGRNDLIVVSPHYAQHAEYASCINQVPPAADIDAMIAPYVWDPSILTRDGALNIRWRPAAAPAQQEFVIMEPNISFQKCSLVPLLILERWYRDSGKAAGWTGKVHVISGERMGMVPHWRENVLTRLEIVRDGRVEFEDRNDIVSTLNEHPSAIFVLHNYNNEYNYMTLELLYTGFPVLHNSPSWKDYGYYYAGADLKAGAGMIREAVARHGEREEAYKAAAAAVQWRHSPYNPDNQAAWRRLLENRGTK